MNIIIALLIFSVIIIIHELGHYVFAKKNGIGVEEFSLGMGPRLLSFVKNETRYSLKLFPIGGACMMTGEDEISSDKKAFGNKGVWARISVVVAGPIFNFILAFLLAVLVISLSGFHVPIITNVNKNSSASEVGLKDGDVIIGINKTKINMNKELKMYLYFHELSDEAIKITYLRNGRVLEKLFYPMKTAYQLGFRYSPDEEKAVIKDIIDEEALKSVGINIGDTIVSINDYIIHNGKELSQYFKDNPLTGETISLGFEHNGKIKIVTIKPSPKVSYNLGFELRTVNLKPQGFQVLRYAALEVKYNIVSTIKGLGYLLSGKIKADETMGAVGLVNEIGKTYDRNIQFGLLSTINALAQVGLLLSANLGVMNLLPIPALDGGRLVFLFLEVIRGKPIDQKKEGIVHFIGFASLIILIMIITINDISRML